MKCRILLGFWRAKINPRSYPSVQTQNLGIAMVGATHHDCPIEVRERLVPDPQLALRNMANMKAHGTESVLLSTCNRTELYISETTSISCIDAFEKVLDIDSSQFADSIQILRNVSSVKHLYEVTSGLNSLVLGESEILGQVKSALQVAQKNGTAGPRLNRLFQNALNTGKKIRTETHIGSNPASISSVSVELARRVFGQDLSKVTFLVVGAGKIGRSTALCIKGSKVGGLTITNRSEGKGRSLAEESNSEFGTWPLNPKLLNDNDVIICCTSSRETLIDSKLISQCAGIRENRPKLILDLAVPRNVDPKVGSFPGIILQNIDDTSHVIDETLEGRKNALQDANAIIDTNVRELSESFNVQNIGQVMAELRGQAEEIRNSELIRTMGKLENLSEQDLDSVSELTTRIINKFLHAPTMFLRNVKDGESSEQTIRDVFGLGKANDTDQNNSDV